MRHSGAAALLALFLLIHWVGDSRYHFSGWGVPVDRAELHFYILAISVPGCLAIAVLERHLKRRFAGTLAKVLIAVWLMMLVYSITRPIPRLTHAVPEHVTASIGTRPI